MRSHLPAAQLGLGGGGGTHNEDHSDVLFRQGLNMSTKAVYPFYYLASSDVLRESVNIRPRPSGETAPPSPL